MSASDAIIPFTKSNFHAALLWVLTGVWHLSNYFKGIFRKFKMNTFSGQQPQQHIAPITVPPVITFILQKLLSTREWRVTQIASYLSSNFGPFVHLKNFSDCKNLYVISSHNLASSILQRHGKDVLVQRFGQDEGLKAMGMFERGLIWNNNDTIWKLHRGIFQKAVLQANTDDLRIWSHRYFERNPIQVAHVGNLGAGSSSGFSMLEWIRGYTLTMTMEGLFRVSILDNVRMDTKKWGAEVIKVVGSYFQAWEFFLLTPDTATRFPEEHQKHIKSVLRMHALGEEILQMHLFYQQHVECENSSDKPTWSFIQALLDQYDIDNPEDRGQIIQCICELLLAGTDTSSLTMFYTLCFLAQQPGLETVSNESLKNLLYESMRLVPVGPVILRKALMDMDVELPSMATTSSYTASSPKYLHVEEGDGVIINVAGMNVTDSIYARSTQTTTTEIPTSKSDSSLAVFDYTRYESMASGSSKNKSSKAPHPISFGLGKKSCVGKEFAMKEMEVFFTWFLKKYTVLRYNPPISSTRSLFPSSSPGKLKATNIIQRVLQLFGRSNNTMGTINASTTSIKDIGNGTIPGLQTRWDIANTPITHIPLTFFPCQKTVYFIGQSSTGKTTLHLYFQDRFPGVKVQSEVARQIIEQQKWTRDQMETDEKVFMELQKRIVEAHLDVILNDQNPEEFTLSDRSFFDALFYLKSRNHHAEYESRLSSPRLQRALGILRDTKRSILIFFPYVNSFVRDDGTRLKPTKELDEVFINMMKEARLKFWVLGAKFAAEEGGCSLTTDWRGGKDVEVGIEKRFEQVLEIIQKSEAE
jgi:nicotinamide riboside kinase